ncbi:MAG: DNA ligase, partial [Gammaproteobacteria bacterium]|nr:DNA ligase [Gammaproteobacteria bacterium]
MFSNKQKEILKLSGLSTRNLTEERVFEIAGRPLDLELSDHELVEFLRIANALYRGGEQIVTDNEYDFAFQAELKRRDPDHPFLKSVEPEPAFVGKTALLPARMLSTEKTYDDEGIKNWINRVRKAAEDIGKNFDTLVFRLTPKLDGFAAYDDGVKFYTRGDGKRGTDITRVFDRGLTIADGGSRGLGAGEIVVSKKYFEKYLSKYFENARNFQASVVKEKELEEHAAKAIKDKAAVFFPFSILPSWEGLYKEMESSYDKLIEDRWNSVDYDVDGVIFEIIDDELKKYMGATNHHHRWQIAFKENVDMAKVKVVKVIPQTSRTGRVNPVVEVEPVRLSGAMIQRVTAHHYGLVKEKGIGNGAIIELVRSGEVIPKIETVVKSAEPEISEYCPSCDTKLVWDKDYLICTNNIECPAQITHTIEHFFKTLGNVDGFGSATIVKLFEHGVRTLPKIYQLTVSGFKEAGFGPKQSENLFKELKRSREEEIEDWRFLAAFGIFRMGTGNCERLLQYYKLEDVFKLKEEDISSVEGFAEKTSEIVVRGLKKIGCIFSEIQKLGFKLEQTPLVSEQIESGEISVIAGKLIVFTGSMMHGSRSDMQVEAKKLGAKLG